jgi:ankyrin repeat protein
MEHTQASELCLAAFSGNTKVVSNLLKVGVDVNASDSGMNALVRASIAGKADIVKLLLSHKADVNLADMVSLLHILAAWLN